MLSARSNILLILTFICIATLSNGQQQCDQQPAGDEVVEFAIPIDSFNTSGNDMVRSTWCIAHCAERISIIATMRYKPANQIVRRHKLKKRFTDDGKVERLVDGKVVRFPTKYGRDDPDDPFNFCMDPFVSALVDAVGDKYNDTTTLAQQLNANLNKPTWGILVYQLGVPPWMIVTENVFHDYDFCEKLVIKQLNGQTVFWQFFLGNVNDN